MKPEIKRLREPKPSHISFRSILPSKKMNRDLEGFCYYKLSQSDSKYVKSTAITGESLLEFRLHILLEHEQKILTYDYQAVLRNKEGKFSELIYQIGQNKSVKWIPDACAIWEGKASLPWIFEVKTLEKIFFSRIIRCFYFFFI